MVSFSVPKFLFASSLAIISKVLFSKTSSWANTVRKEMESFTILWKEDENSFKLNEPTPTASPDLKRIKWL